MRNNVRCFAYTYRIQLIKGICRRSSFYSNQLCLPLLINKPTENNKSRNNKLSENSPVTCQPKTFTQASLPETSKQNERNTARVFGNTVMISHGYSDNLYMYKSKFDILENIWCSLKAVAERYVLLRDSV